MARKAKTTETKPANDYAVKRKAALQKVEDEHSDILMHRCKVTGGRKLEIGTKVDCIWIGVNRYLAPLARCVHDGKDVWMQPKHLESLEVLPKAKQAAYSAEMDEQKNATVYVPGIVRRETDKSILLAYSGWFKNIYFSKEMAVKTDAVQGDCDIFEIPAWKVRKECGADALAALEAKQAELEKLVNAA